MIVKRCWKIDPSFTREKHSLRFHDAYEQEWGATVRFICENEGCEYAVSLSVQKPDVQIGICFDAKRGEVVQDE